MAGRKWTKAEDQQLRARYGLWSLKLLAKRMGRTETAVNIRAKRLNLWSIENSPHLFTCGALCDALGVDVKTAMRLMNEELSEYVVHRYRRNSRTPVVALVYVVIWIADPMNWYSYDPDKARHPRLVTAVKKARRNWDDEWWTTGPAIKELAVCKEWLNYRLRTGLIRGRKYGHNWMVLRSDVMKVKAELHSGNGWLRSVCDETAVKEFARL